MNINQIESNDPKVNMGEPTTKLNSTIKGRDSIMDPWDAPNTGPQKEPPPESFPEDAPSSRETPPVDERESMPMESFPSNPASGKRLAKTIDPSRTPVDSRQFCLRAVAREGEASGNELRFSGDKIELNRSNVDPNNYSITSKTQAVLEYIDGAWYIIDQSALQTTFVHAKQAVKLSPGDIILMGNRKFVFEEV
ncbi:MAG: FHA domain-containing protein [Bacteroidetes bacterium]|nr:MAG: FHA domain-containing protein [Bacteroidota bacterium]